MRNAIGLKLSGLIFGVLLAGPVLAQQWDTRQAEIQNKDVSGGKCTAVVRVDGAVEIELYGTTARMRTLAGAPGQWQRFDCNMGMPSNPNQFVFSPQDGRGSQTLVMQPGQNRGVAVVRLEDPSGGAGDYKFDIEWQGGTDNSSSIFSGVFGGGNTQTDKNAGFGGASAGTVSASSLGWNRQINLQNSGQGYYRTFNRADSGLGAAQVSIDQNGAVRVNFSSSDRGTISLNGNVIYVNGNQVIAEVTSSGATGVMELLLDNQNRVEEIAVTGTGPDRFEARWQMR